MMPQPYQGRLRRDAKPKPRADTPDDDVEVNSDDSFPASDAPSWGPLHVGAPGEHPPPPGERAEPPGGGG